MSAWRKSRLDKLDIKEENGKMIVIAGALDELIEALTDENYAGLKKILRNFIDFIYCLDYDFIHTFVLTYRYFLLPGEFMKSLIKRFFLSFPK